jgi:hypothetical protein
LTALNILSVSGFLLFVGLAARNLVAALSQQGIADRIHKIALIGEILIVSLSGFLALIGCYAPIYLLVAGASAYLVSRSIGRRYANRETKSTRVRSANPEVTSRPDSWSSFALVFVGTAAVIVLAWNVRNDFFGSEKRMIIGDDAAYHVPIVLNLERHRSLWFPLEDYQIDVPDVGVHSGNDARIFFPLNHELLVALARFASGPAVEFMRVINYLLMFHLILAIYCLLKLAVESNATTSMIALACFVLPVFQGRFLPGQISVFGNLNNDLFVTLLVLSGVYLAIEQWCDMEAGSSAPRLHSNALLLGTIILVAVGTKWYAALYSLVLQILFFIPVVVDKCWRDLKIIKLALTLCLVAIVTNGALVRNVAYFGAVSADFHAVASSLQPLAFLVLSTGEPFAEIGQLVQRAMVTHGGGLSVVFPAFVMLQAFRYVLLICREPQTPFRAIVEMRPVVLGVLSGLIGCTMLVLFFAIPFAGGWPYFPTTVRYAMPAFVLFHCAVLTLHGQETRWVFWKSSRTRVRQQKVLGHPEFRNAASKNRPPLVPIILIASASVSLMQYFLFRHAALLIGAASVVSIVVLTIRSRICYGWRGL